MWPGHKNLKLGNRCKLDTRDENSLNEYFSKEIYSASRFYKMSKQLSDGPCNNLKRIWQGDLKCSIENDEWLRIISNIGRGI